MPRRDRQVRGRFLGADGGRWWVATADGDVPMAAPPGAAPPPPGAWVVAAPGGPVEVVATPRRPFPEPTSDWARLRADGGRRARNLRARARLFAAIRAFFDARDFLEVDTPLRVPNPGLDPHLEPFPAGEGRWLATSPELQMKRLVGAGLERVYQLGRSFRAGERGPLHEPEFSMLEWYRAFAGSDAIRGDTEALVADGARALGLDDLRARRPGGGEVDLSPPWPRIPMREAFRRFAGLSMDEVLPDEARFFRVLVEAIEPALAASGRPAFLTRWPASTASLARLAPDDPTVADRFEAYAGGLELCNGFDELTDPDEQRRRFERDRAARAAAGRPTPDLDDRFLAALEDGLPPTAGNALGVDRLLLLLTGEATLGAVVPFPDAAV